MSSGVRGGAAANLYQNHKLRDAAGKTGLISAEAYLKAVSSAQDEFLSRMSKLASEKYDATVAADCGKLDEMPLLATPKGAEPASTGKVGATAGAGVKATGSDATTHGAAALTEILGQLMKLIGDGSIDQLQRNAATWNQLSKEMQNQLEALGKQYDADRKAAEDAGANAKTAQDAEAAAQTAADQADADAKAADQAYEDAKNDKHTSKEDLQKKKDAADAADKKKKEAHEALGQAKGEAKSAQDAATKANSVFDAINDDCNAQIGKAEQQLNGQSQSGQGSRLRGAAAMTEIFGRLQELISNGNLNSLESKRELYQAMQVQREQQLQKKSDDYEAQVKKAEEMQKTMGCIGKILGFLVTAVSVAAAAFTGGASLAIAAVGLALMVGDEISQAAFGFSFMNKIMDPVMNAVLKPIMNLFSSLITQALESAGVDKDKAEIAGAVLGAVLTAAVIVAAVVVAGSVAEEIASKVTDAIAEQMTKVMDSAMVKMMTEFLDEGLEKTGLRTLATRASSAMGRLRGAVGVETQEDAQVVAGRLEQAAAVVQVGNAATQTAGSIIVGIEESNAMRTLGQMKLAMADIKILSDLLKRIVETYSHQSKALSQIMQNMSDSLATETSTGLSILRNTRAV